MANRKWKAGDRFHFVRKLGGWGHGTVLRVKGDTVFAHLDIQKEGEEYGFHTDNPNFFPGEIKEVTV